MIFRPDIKPPMWGPPEAVQYAVRANAERLGIDPGGIVELRPFWEVGGLTSYNVVTDTRDRLLDGATFTQNSVFFRGGQNKDRIVSSVVSSPQLDSIFCFFKTKARAFNKTYDDWSDWICLTLDNGKEIVVEIKNTGVPAVYGIGDVAGFSQISLATIDVREKNVTVSFHNSSLLVNGEIADTTNTWNTGRTITRITWGNRYSSITLRCIHADIYIGLILADTPNAAQIAQLHHEPYALLMPVSRPFIFDMAGGGGVYTIGKAGLGYSGAPLYGSLFSEIPSITSSLSGKYAKGSATVKPQKASLAFSGQEASTGLLTTIGRSISNFAGHDIVSGTLVSVGQAVFSFVGNAAKGGIKSVIAKFGLTSSTGEVNGNTTTSTPSVGFTYQGNEAKANTKATVDSKSFGLNGRGVIVNGVAEIIRRAVKIIGSSLQRIIG